MPFNEAKAKLTPARRTALDSLLEVWDATNGIPPQAAANLRAEQGGAINDFANYLAALADNQPHLGVGGPGPRAVFEQVGKTFALAGHEASPYIKAIFGRAMLLANFARCLAPKLEEVGCLDTDEDIHDSLRFLDGTDEPASPSRFRIYFQAIKRTPLGRAAVFATFVKPVLLDRRPWEAPLPDATTIRNAMALGEDPIGQDYILFAYRLPEGTLPHVPTTASPGWSYQKWFRPNSDAVADRHGWIVPLDASLEKQPEIVHSEIDGATLTFPIHISTA